MLSQEESFWLSFRYKPGAECQRVFSDDEDLWKEKLKTPGQKEFSDKEGKREREKRKKDFKEAENKLKELELSERELTCLLSFIQDRVQELGALMVRLHNGVLEVIPHSWQRGYVMPRGQVLEMNPEICALSHYRDNGHHGYNNNHGYVPPHLRDNNNRGYVPPVNVGVGGAHGYVPPVQNDNHGYVPPHHGYNNNHGYVPPNHGYNNNHGY